jgi:hypothetical protein
MAKKLIGTDGGGGVRGTGMSGGGGGSRVRGGKGTPTSPRVVNGSLSGDKNPKGNLPASKAKNGMTIVRAPNKIVQVKPKSKAVVNVTPKPKVNGGTMYFKPKSSR